MKFHRLVLGGFAAAFVLAGCKSDSPKAADASLPDGPGADRLAPDATTDSAAAIKNDTATSADTPTLSDTRVDDTAMLPDARVDGAAADLRVADAVGVESRADASAADQLPAETGTGDTRDTPAARADGSLAEMPGDGSTGEAGCSGWTTLVRLAPADAKALIETSDPIVINVHYPYQGDIPGTDATIPYDDVDAIEAYLGYDHCADLLLVCESGGMSASAGNELIKRGYQRVRDLKGGMMAWEAAGYALLKDGGV